MRLAVSVYVDLNFKKQMTISLALVTISPIKTYHFPQGWIEPEKNHRKQVKRFNQLISFCLPNDARIRTSVYWKNINNNMHAVCLPLTELAKWWFLSQLREQNALWRLKSLDNWKTLILIELWVCVEVSFYIKPPYIWILYRREAEYGANFDSHSFVPTAPSALGRVSYEKASLLSLII